MNLPDGNAKRILIVEDEPAIAALCLRVLTREGLEVDMAVNGKVAQDRLEEKQYDLCLIDIRTPQMNGKELYQWLKEQRPQLVSRLIFTTGDVMGGDTRSFLEQAARPLLAKPFTIDELKAIVREALEEVEK